MKKLIAFFITALLLAGAWVYVTISQAIEASRGA